MPVPMQRPDRYKVGVAIQTSITDTTPLATEELVSPQTCDVSSVYQAEVEDEAHTEDGQARPSIAGTWHDNAQPSVTIAVEGSRSTIGTAAPTETAFCRLVAGAMQSAPTLRAGNATASLALGVLTLDDDAKDPGDGNVTIVHATDDDGAIHATPVVGTSVSAAFDVLMDPGGTYAMAPPVLPDIDFPWTGAWTDLPVALRVTAYAAQAHKGRRVYGCVAGMAIGAVGPNEIPYVEFPLRASTGEREIAPIADAAPYWAPRVFRCSELRLAAYGESDAPRIAGRIEWSIPGYTPIQNPNTCGVDSWIREDGAGEVTLTLPLGTIPTDVGGLSDTWEQAWREQELYHLLVSYGQRARGGILSVYWDELVLRRPDDTEIDDVMGRTLHFRPAAGSRGPHISLA